MIDVMYQKNTMIIHLYNISFILSIGMAECKFAVAPLYAGLVSSYLAKYAMKYVLFFIFVHYKKGSCTIIC